MSLKIAIVHVADQGGGAERSVLTLHQSLRAQGHDCRLFVGNRQTDEPGVIEIPRKRTIPGVLRITSRLEQSGLQNLYAPWFRQLPELIGNVDIVHLHSLWKVRHNFADMKGIEILADRYPVTMTLRDGWMLTGHCACPIKCDRWKTGCGRCPDLNRPPSVQRDWTALNWRRKQQTVRKSEVHITAVSTWLADQISQSPIFTGKPVHVVHNSVDETEFQPGDRTQARTRLNIPPDAFVVLLAGQSIEGFHQGISQHAVAALNQLADHSIHVMLVGRSAQDVAKTLQIPCTTVPFRRTQREMAECYQAADLTIVPSEYETFGRVAAESLFCGTPVLAFATGGLTDIVIEDVCGRLVPTGDTSALAQQIASLRNDPDTLQSMRSRCADSARQRFNTQCIAKRYVEVYRATIADRTASAVGVAQPERRFSETTMQPACPGTSTKPKTPTISCIIPAWNCEAWLKRAVDSVLQTGYPELDIIIVDDGSTDGTHVVADSLQQQHPDLVRVLSHPGRVNKGVSASRNLGLAHARGEWICFLDADDYVYPHRFDSATTILTAHPEVDGVHQLSEMVFPSEEASERWWKNSPYFGFEQTVKPEELLNHLLTGRCWATSAIVFRRQLLEKTGVFHEQLSVAEDCHLWFRMAAVGRLVSGDLTRPVSAYWRRLDSAYQPSPRQRLQMIKSMTAFLTWLEDADVPSEVLAGARRDVQKYITTGLTNARFDKERRLAWSIAWHGLRGQPSISVNPEFCGQLARLAAGR